VGGNCGFTVEHTLVGEYKINLGFQVSDRFISITPKFDGRKAANFFNLPNANEIEVVTFNTHEPPGSGFADADFMIIVY
jgi:hypothetical protein